MNLLPPSSDDAYRWRLSLTSAVKVREEEKERRGVGGKYPKSLGSFGLFSEQIPLETARPNTMPDISRAYFFCFYSLQHYLCIPKSAAMAMPGTETIRFRRPTNKNDPAPEPKRDQFGDMAPQGWKRRHQGLLQDLLRRYVDFSSTPLWQ